MPQDLNPDQQRFIEDVYREGKKSTKTRNTAIMALEYFVPFEKVWGTDFTRQPLTILQDAFNLIVGSKHAYAVMLLSEYKEYATWRMRNGLDKTRSSIHKVVVDNSQGIRREMVSSPEHLEKALNCTTRPSFLGTVDVIYRVFMWLAFMGFDSKDVPFVTKENVNFVTQQITYNGKTYPMYSPSLMDFRIACDATLFEEPCVNGSSSFTRSYERADGNQILRGKLNKRQVSPDRWVASTFMPTWTKLMRNAEQAGALTDDVPHALTFDRIRLSGLFYRWYTEEQAGRKPDIDGFVQDIVAQREAEGKPYKTSKNFPMSSVIAKFKRIYTADYNNWKQAFYGK